MGTEGRQNSMIMISALLQTLMESKDEIKKSVEDGKIDKQEAFNLFGMVLKAAILGGLTILAAKQPV